MVSGRRNFGLSSEMQAFRTTKTLQARCARVQFVRLSEGTGFDQSELAARQSRA